MAKYLASIFATEKDQVNCPFYFKIGACRDGNDCSRYHIRSISSPTLIFYNMYQPPDPTITPAVNIQDHVDNFFEDVYIELSKYGKIETLNICDNLADHMRGNVYVLFEEEDQAAAALSALRGRFYYERTIVADFSHVTDFSEATCMQYEEGTCNKGELCNFMHIKKIREKLRRKLFGRYHSFGSRSRSGRESRSRSPTDRCNKRDYERHERRSPEREGSED